MKLLSVCVFPAQCQVRFGLKLSKTIRAFKSSTRNNIMSHQAAIVVLLRSAAAFVGRLCFFYTNTSIDITKINE